MEIVLKEGKRYWLDSGKNVSGIYRGVDPINGDLRFNDIEGDSCYMKDQSGYTPFRSKHLFSSVGLEDVEVQLLKMEFKHTPGPWQEHKFGEAVYTNKKRVCVTSTQRTTASEEDKANAKLIAASPSMLQTILDTYIALQMQANRDVLFACHTDGTRASLRNQISVATGVDCRVIQEHVEQLCMTAIDKILSKSKDAN